MSFAFTPEEQSRVEVAKFLGINITPIGYVDLSTIIVLSTMYLVEFVALCYQLRNRDYLPLKVKNVPVMFSLYFGGVGWMLGDMFTGGLVHLRQSALLRNCAFTVICLRICIGAYYVTSVFALRCFSLYHVFYKGKAFKGKIVLLSFGVTILSIVLFGVISAVLPPNLTVRYEDILDLCYYNKGYAGTVVIIIWSTWLYTCYMNWRLRKVAFCFNERVEIASIFVITLVIVTMNTVCLFVVNVYAASLAWRTALIYTNHVGASTIYWIVMFEPTYNCMFNREEYLQYWINILKEDHMEREYGYASEFNNETTLNWADFDELPSKASTHSPSTQNVTTCSMNEATMYVPPADDASVGGLVSNGAPK
ncbi:hypothetical protein H4R18_000370 [Coemansia javaensis]|uniref:Uncharacterized protein n=1 Tax=Coemansia javaensis TaxID=2761396 RepID=A0A9W8HPQ9_9FUNG|nr:hypothetical protein H4R18_000370 [Coemansia javaensis]